MTQTTIQLKMSKMRNKLTLAALSVVFTSSVFTACKRNDDIKPEENEEEVITTMKLTFEPVGGGETLTFQFKDEDGPGGADPVQDEIVLAPNKEYNVSLQLLNETHTPAEDITEEVEEEADEHRVYYQPSSGSNITVSNLDTDTNGIPLGITSKWTTTDVATGTIKITLRHYAGNPPNKAIDDAVDNAKSSTDVAVEFSTSIH